MGAGVQWRGEGGGRCVREGGRGCRCIMKGGEGERAADV